MESNLDSLVDFGRIASAVRGLRVRSGRSVRDIAGAGGFGATNSYVHYEKGFKGDYLPFNVAEKLARAVVGFGQPPITEAEILALVADPERVIIQDGELGDLTALVSNVSAAPGAPMPPVYRSMPRSVPVVGADICSSIISPRVSA
jgi:hypothetical protein